MNTLTAAAVALAVAGGILVLRNRRRSRSLDEASIEGAAKMNGASTLTSQADAEKPSATTLSKSVQSTDATESTSEVSTETDDKTD